MLYTSHQYDTSNRIKSQKWQMDNQSFYETYTYNSLDGTLQSVVLSGETLGFSYDNLKQLSKRTSPKLDIAYDYRVRNSSAGLVSNQIASMQYLKHGTNKKLLPTINYTYDTYGNIRSKSIEHGGTATERYAFIYENNNWLDQPTKVSYTGKNVNNSEKDTANSNPIINDEKDSKILGNIHSTQRLKNDFNGLEKGDALEEVRELDPDGEYLFLYTGRNDSQKISHHYTKDGYLISINYDDSNRIVSIEKELI